MQKLKIFNPKMCGKKLFFFEKPMGSERNFKITKETGGSVARDNICKQGVGNQGQGVGIPSKGETNCEEMNDLKSGMKSMSEWNDECVILIEKKKQKRVLPEWILKGGKKTEPPDTEKITSAKAEKSNSKVEILTEKNEKKEEGKNDKKNHEKNREKN